MSPDEKQTIITHIIPDKFRDDIRSLTDYVGEASFQSELCIEVSLAELLKVVPRKRRRRDAYDTLVKYLKEERNITLKINKK